MLIFQVKSLFSFVILGAFVLFTLFFVVHISNPVISGNVLILFHVCEYSLTIYDALYHQILDHHELMQISMFQQFNKYFSGGGHYGNVTLDDLALTFSITFAHVTKDGGVNNEITTAIISTLSDHHSHNHKEPNRENYLLRIIIVVSSLLLLIILFILFIAYKKRSTASRDIEMTQIEMTGTNSSHDNEIQHNPEAKISRIDTDEGQNMNSDGDNIGDQPGYSRNNSDDIIIQQQTRMGIGMSDIVSMISASVARNVNGIDHASERRDDNVIIQPIQTTMGNDISDIVNIINQSVPDGDNDVDDHKIEEDENVSENSSDSEPFYDTFAMAKQTSIFVEDPDKNNLSHIETDGNGTF